MKKAAKKTALTLLGFIIATALSGCLYPGEKSDGDPVAVRESILIVGNAVDQYRQKNGVLPIKNSAMDTPVYEKYIIDLRLLKERGYISRIPSVAFESGGTAMFVLIHPEEQPEVKLLDVAAYQKINDLQLELDRYRERNAGDLPKGEQVAPGFYRINFSRLGREPLQIRSPYSPLMLGVIMTESGQAAIDYAPEIARLVNGKGTAPAGDIDLRSLLTAESFYVPVKSYPYRWLNGQPVVMEK